jgi:hypothetical protein
MHDVHLSIMQFAITYWSPQVIITELQDINGMWNIHPFCIMNTKLELCLQIPLLCKLVLFCG